MKKYRWRSGSITSTSLKKGKRGVPVFAVDHEDYDPRPQTRAECENLTGPCPWVSCRYHLYLDVNHLSGAIKLNFPNMEPWEIPETCSLEVAERGGITLEEIGGFVNISRERVRQMEGVAKRKFKKLFVISDK